MFNLQPTDLLGILIVALLLFGPSRLPQIGRAMGSTLREFQSATREATQSFQAEVKSEVTTEQVKTEEDKKEEVATAACKNCGKSIKVGTRFCYECGAAQEPAAA